MKEEDPSGKARNLRTLPPDGGNRRRAVVGMRRIRMYLSTVFVFFSFAFSAFSRSSGRPQLSLAPDQAMSSAASCSSAAARGDGGWLFAPGSVDLEP